MDKKDTYQLTYFVPTPVWEMFQKRVRDYRFQSVGRVIYYLLDSYRKQYNKEKISLTMRNILQRASEDWFILFKYDERSQSAITVDRRWAADIMNISRLAGFKDRSRLVAVLIGCFVSSPKSLLKKMSQEMYNQTISVNSSEVLSTYISFYQYAVLGLVSKRMNISISGLLNMLLDILIESNDENSNITFSGGIHDLINDVLTIRGYTTKDFRREKDISVYISGEERQMNILKMMMKYDIPTPCEFLRRLILFFLNAQYVLFKNENKSIFLNEQEKEPDYEDTMYSTYAKNDFSYKNDFTGSRFRSPLRNCDL